MAEGHLSIDVLYTNPKTIWSVMWCTATLCCLVTLVVVQSHKRRHARLNAELMPRYGKSSLIIVLIPDLGAFFELVQLFLALVAIRNFARTVLLLFGGPIKMFDEIRGPHAEPTKLWAQKPLCLLWGPFYTCMPKRRATLSDLWKVRWGVKQYLFFSPLLALFDVMADGKNIDTGLVRPIIGVVFTISTMVGMYCLFVWLGVVTPLIKKRVARRQEQIQSDNDTAGAEGGEGGGGVSGVEVDYSVLTKLDKQFKVVKLLMIVPKISGVLLNLFGDWEKIRHEHMVVSKEVHIAFYTAWIVSLIFPLVALVAVMAFPATEGYYREVVMAGTITVTDSAELEHAEETMEMLANATPTGLSSEPAVDLESGSVGGGSGSGSGSDDGDGGNASTGEDRGEGGGGGGDPKDEKDEQIHELKGQLAELKQTVCALQSNQLLGVLPALGVLDFDDESSSLVSAGGRSRQTSNASASSDFLDVPRAIIELTGSAMVPRGNDTRDAAHSA